MSVARVYQLVAAKAGEIALKDFLVELAAAVSALPGCSDVEVLQDSNDISRFLFIEHWESIAAHKYSSPKLSKVWFERMKPLLAGPPESSFQVVVSRT